LTFSRNSEKSGKNSTVLRKAIEDLIDSTLTPEEDELLKEVREKIRKGDFSEFIPLEKLDEALEDS